MQITVYDIEKLSFYYYNIGPIIFGVNYGFSPD